jgi:hypothetical protein
MHLLNKQNKAAVPVGTAVLLFLSGQRMPAEKECGAPDACQSHNGVNQSAEQRTLAAKQPCYQIKLENTNQAPVQTSDDGKNQRNGIHDIPPFFPDAIVFPRGEKL